MCPFMKLVLQIGKDDQATVLERLSALAPIGSPVRTGTGGCEVNLGRSSLSTKLSVRALLQESGIPFSESAE